MMQCAVCGRKNLEQWDIKDKEYRYCPGCGFIQLAPEYFPGELEERTRYLQHTNTTADSRYVAYLQDFLTSSFYPYVRQNSTALDFGCGPEPVLAKILQHEGFTIDCYDPFFAPDVPWKTKTYDAITAVEVFEHLQDPAGELEALAAAVHDNGYILLRTMLHTEKKDSFSCWWYREDSTHVSFFSERTIKTLAERYRLSISSIKNSCEIVLKKQPPLLTKIF